MTYYVDKEAGIANRGNWARIKNVMKRAMAGELLTLGFLGGSITQGCLSSVHETCYAYLTYEWWKKTFPKAQFTYCNAGIGGTTSHFGTGRVEEDLLIHKPDFVIVEFSVNDDSTEFFKETYEGLIRKIYTSETKPAILIVNNVFYDTGANAQLMHNRIGRHYDIPCVSMQSSIFPQVVNGSINNRELTTDDLHPNDAGHELVMEVITHYLDKMLKDIDTEETEPEYPKPVTENRYEAAKRYRSKDVNAILVGFEEAEREQKDLTDCFKGGWYSKGANARLELDIPGTEIAVQYRKSMSRKSCAATVTIDGDVEHSTILDGNFDENWGDKLELTVVAENLCKGTHHVTITTENKDCEVPFMVVSVIASESK